MRKYHLTVNDKSFTITVRDFSTQRAEMEINGTLYNVRVDDIVTEGESTGRPVRPSPSAPSASAAAPARGAAPAAAAAAPAAGGGAALTAPIPGQILEIFVKVGEQVQAGGPVLKMEAMKMENVIAAHASGTIVSISVGPGDAVNQGQELLSIA